jgi:hypothetical protein
LHNCALLIEENLIKESELGRDNKINASDKGVFHENWEDWLGLVGTYNSLKETDQVKRKMT